MKSLFKETKLYFDDLFQDNWDETPIQYAGEEFDTDGTAKWINIFYQPSFNATVDLCGTTNNMGNLLIGCWADTDVDVLEVSDNLVSFANTYFDKNLYRVRNFEISEHGWNTNNKVYTIVSFSIEVLGR